MLKSISRHALLASVGATVAGVLVATAVSAATFTVSALVVDPLTPYANPGWVKFERESGVVKIGADYGAPAGFGSSALVLDTPLNNDKAQAFKSVVADGVGVPLASVASLSYWAYRSSASTASPLQAPALNIEIDTNGLANPGGFATLVYEPVYNNGGTPYPQNTWTLNDAYIGGSAIWWSTKQIPGVPSAFSSFVPWSAIVAANPDAVVLRYGINQGSGNPGLFAAADGFTFNGATNDFEAFNPTKDDCKDGGWATKWASGTFKNQGACVSYFARRD